MEDQDVTSELNEVNRTSEIDDAAEPSEDGEGDVEIEQVGARIIIRNGYTYAYPYYSESSDHL